MAAADTIVVSTRAPWAYFRARASKVLPHVLMEAVLLVPVSLFLVFCGFVAIAIRLIHLADHDFVVFATLSSSIITLNLTVKRCRRHKENLKLIMILNALRPPLILSIPPVTVTVVTTSCCIGRLLTPMVFDNHLVLYWCLQALILDAL